MDTASARRPPRAPRSWGLMRSITRTMRFRRGNCRAAHSTAVDDDHKVSKSLDPHHHGSSLLSKSIDDNDAKQQQQGGSSREAMVSLLASLFASVSAIKASYAQLQLAQSPYDPEAIQTADLAVVTELKHISHLKHAYLRNQLPPTLLHPDDAQLAAEVQEHRNLLKTFQITVRKLEAEVQRKDAEVGALQEELMEAERLSRAMEASLHRRRSLSALGDLQLSELNPTHFLAVLRYAVKSIRAFVGALVREMETAGWDLAAAAAAVEPDVARGRPEHCHFAFESFVCRRMFANFQHAHFGGFPTPADRAPSRRRRFFDEFVEMKDARAKDLLGDRLRGLENPFGRFWRAKYEAVVHPKMEASFFGGLDQRAALLLGPREGLLETAFFHRFSEMARRVWLLHRLFFSFEDEAEIFQCERGSRFSEVYMESVEEMAAAAAAAEGRTVGFTVVPGFRVGKTVIQCRVYLASA